MFYIVFIAPGHVETSVEGDGELVSSYDEVLKSTNPKEPELSTFERNKKCMPHPREPDWEVYYQMRENLFSTFIFLHLNTIKRKIITGFLWLDWAHIESWDECAKLNHSRTDRAY